MRMFFPLNRITVQRLAHGSPDDTSVLQDHLAEANWQRRPECACV